LAQGDISIRIMLCIMRMAMVSVTIGKAEVNFMSVILGRGERFVNGRRMNKQGFLKVETESANPREFARIKTRFARIGVDSRIK